MTVQERINRNELDDKIYIGDIVQKATEGEFGEVLRCIINGMFSEELQRARNKETISSDRVLGRMESLDMLQDRLIMCIKTKDQLLAIQRRDAEVKQD